MQKLTGYPSIDKPWMKYYSHFDLDYNFPSMTAYDYMVQRSAAYGDYVAMTYYGKQIKYHTLHENIVKAAKALVHMGVKPDDRVLFLMPNIPETAYLFYACSLVGAVADYMDPRPDSIDPMVSAQKTLKMMIREKITHVAALDMCYLAMLAPIEKEMKANGIENVMLVSAADSMGPLEMKAYFEDNVYLHGLKQAMAAMKRSGEMKQKVQTVVSLSELHIQRYVDVVKAAKDAVLPKLTYVPGSLCVITHTSGTTSALPKPMPLTHDNLNVYSHQQQWVANTITNVGDKSLHILPYFAAYGLANMVHGNFCMGVNLIEIPEFQITDLGKIILHYQPQEVMGTPNWYVALMKDEALNGKDLSFLNFPIYGGDGMNEEDEREFNQFLHSHNCDCNISKGHGMSETCGCATLCLPNIEHYNTVGIPLPMTTYAVVDPETKELLRIEDGEDTVEGELIISSGAVTPGILDGEVIVPHVQYNGDDYILTGDIARIGRDGYIQFCARKDRSFTRYDGYKVKCYAIEDIIKYHDAVRYCVIAPLNREEMFGNVVVANIVPNQMPANRQEAVALTRAIITECFMQNEDASARQIPSVVRYLPDFPMTANGKINFRAITAMPLDGNEINISFEASNIELSDVTIE